MASLLETSLERSEVCDETEWLRLTIHKPSGHACEITVREDDLIRDVRRKLIHLSWAHVELSLQGRPQLLEDKQLVKDLVQSPSGDLHMVVVQSQLVMACVGKELVLWGCQCGSLQILKKFNRAPTALLADPASLRVLVGCSDGHLELLKFKEQKEQSETSIVFKRRTGCGWVQCIQAFWEQDLAVVAYHNDDSWLVTYRLSDPAPLNWIQLPDRVMQIAVGSVGFSGDLKVCISSCLEHGPVLSYLDGSHQLHGGIARSGSLTALDVDWKGQRIITGTDRGTLDLWSFTGKIQLLKCARQANRPARQADIRAVAANWLTETAVTASSDGVLRLWDLRDCYVLTQFEGHTGVIYSISADFVQGFMCTAGVDGAVKLWKIAEKFEKISEMPRSPKEKCLLTSIIPAGAAACQLLNSLGSHEI